MDATKRLRRLQYQLSEHLVELMTKLESGSMTVESFVVEHERTSQLLLHIGDIPGIQKFAKGLMDEEQDNIEKAKRAPVVEIPDNA